jgi:HTH-type transcriptional regulator, sugar sensing transcriptional regulator
VDGRRARRRRQRVEQLVEEAESRIIFGVHDASLFPETIADALRECAEAGVDVLVVADDPAIRERFDELPIVSLPDEPPENRAGRVLVVDDDSVLISVLGGGETAIWSS